MQIVTKLAAWLVFSLLIGLLPLFWFAFSYELTWEDKSLVSVLEHGEIFLLYTALGGATIGEIILSDMNKFRLAKILLMGSLLIFCMSCVSFYSQITAALAKEQYQATTLNKKPEQAFNREFLLSTSQQTVIYGSLLCLLGVGISVPTQPKQRRMFE
ncbi:hypothetical protein [Pseudoalteromonas gelatinilytica]